MKILKFALLHIEHMGRLRELLPDICGWVFFFIATVEKWKSLAVEWFSANKNVRNRFLTQFYVRHSGATLFLKVISREVRGDWSWRSPNSEYQIISKWICTVTQPHFSQIPCMHPDTLEADTQLQSVLTSRLITFRKKVAPLCQTYFFVLITFRTFLLPGNHSTASYLQN